MDSRESIAFCEKLFPERLDESGLRAAAEVPPRAEEMAPQEYRSHRQINGITFLITMADHSEFLPPQDLWPDLVFSLPQFQYPERLNVAVELLDKHVLNGKGEATAVWFENENISYSELQKLTNQIGNALKRLGIGPSDRVALRMLNRPVFVAAWLAIQKIGAVGVATMPMLRARELAFIFNDCGARVCLCDVDLAEEPVRARPQLDQPIRIVTTGAVTVDESDARLEVLLSDASENL